MSIKELQNSAKPKASRRRCRRLADDDGFVLPLAVFGIVLMTVIAVVSLLMAGDELRSSSAMRQSSAAFYAAEAGINQLYAGWDTLLPALDSLAPGDSLNLGWQGLNANSSYRAIIRRTDIGGQRMFAVRVEGRAAGQLGGRKTLTLTVTSLANANYALGECCEAAITMRGGARVWMDTRVSGFDQVPAGWDSVCPEPEDDKPGMLMKDTTKLAIGDEVWAQVDVDDYDDEYDEYGDDDNSAVVGVPPVAEDASINDATFDQMGDLTWVDLKGLADHTIDTGGSSLNLDGDIYPRYNADGTCDTSHPYNWGSKDPSDPCFDYFPIILVKGELELHYGYGQAIVVIDWDDSKPAGEKGGEFELETNFEMNGLILGKGCVEIQKGAVFHGAVFVDANYRNEDLCSEDTDFEMNQGPSETNWSRCVVDRVIGGSALEAEAGGGLGRAKFLPSRSFGELFE